MTSDAGALERIADEIARDLVELPGLGAADGLPRQRRADALMSRLFELGRAVQAEPSWRAQPAYDRLARAVEAALDAAYVDLQLVLAEISGMLWGGWSEGDWEKLCLRRSALAFFEDLFHAALEAHEYGAFDTHELDERIRTKAEYEGWLDPGAVPAGVPPSHWWWWSPREPPAAQA